jgi:RimJ/RimL family protein N-acetyltransferase
MKRIETPRLILRDYVEADFDALYAMLSDPETMKHYEHPYDEAGARRWLAWSLENYRTHGFGWWAMIRKDTGEFIGDCGVTMQRIDGELLPEIGYHIHKDHWRRGYGKEAARAVLDWAFENTDFDCLYAYMTDGNVASWATACSIGMTLEKEYCDAREGVMRVYSVTREQWRKDKQ